jgi:hypothetical protein
MPDRASDAHARRVAFAQIDDLVRRLGSTTRR